MKNYFLTLISVAALLSVAGCRRSETTGTAVDDAFLPAIPPDAQTLFSINVDKLKSSDLYTRHERELQLPQLNALAQRVGLDPRRDLSKILVVWDGKHLLLQAKGALSQKQLEEKLIASGAQRVPFKGFTLFSRESEAVAFPGQGIALAASVPALQAALERRTAGGGSVPAELKDRLAEVPGEAQIWVISRGGLPTANFSLRSDLDSALSNITVYVSGVSLGLAFDSGSHVQSRILCKSPEGAQRVHDAMRGLIGLARLTTKDDQLDLLRMWDAISITKDRDALKVQADLPADLTDKLLQQLAKTPSLNPE